MDPLRIVVRCVFAWIFLLAGTRLSGKRTIAGATVFDFVLALILGDMVDDLLWAEVSLATFSAAVGTLLMLEVTGDALSARFPAVAHAMGSSPVTLMRRGHLVHRGARTERLRPESVEVLLRQEGVPPEDHPHVQDLSLDGGGQPTVLMRPGQRPADYRQLDRLKARRRKR